jgi:DNA-binding NarL/FixJ family response regulator
MINPPDVGVVICAELPGIGSTLRMALRGMGFRRTAIAADTRQVLDGFAAAEPNVAVVFLSSGEESDPGLQMLKFLRRSTTSPDRRIPVVAVSPQRDITTIKAAANNGAHEYVLFPASGEALLKKIEAALGSNRPFIDTTEYVGPQQRTAPPPKS